MSVKILTEKVYCAHCGDECRNAIVDWKEQKFCCEGCKLVYEILSENNLTSYYALNKTPGTAQRKKRHDEQFAYLDVEALKKHDLEKSDELANEVHNWAIGLASIEGGATGAAGVFGIAFDIPSIIVIALRTIHKTGVCYGFEVRTKSDKNFVLAILAASGANDMAEKVTALGTLRAIEVAVAKQTW